MFFDKFHDLLPMYSGSCSDFVVLDDFNFHYDSTSNSEVKQLKTVASS